MTPGSKLISWSGTGGVLADAELLFAADEAGNTGANHLDVDQPYYVTGGWLFREPDIERVRLTVYQALLTTGMKELKGSRMLKTPKGTAAALELVTTLLGFCTPIIVCIEKRYALAGRVIDSFVAHPAGPLFGPNHPDPKTSRAYATMVAGLPSGVLHAANEYVMHPSAATAATCASLLEEALLEEGHDELSRLVRLSQQSPTRWWAIDNVLERSNSPNVMAFNTLFQKLELVGADADRSVSILHDDLPHLAPIYEFYHHLATTRRRPEVFVKAGSPTLVTHVNPPRFMSSEDEAVLQAADVMCSTATLLLGQLACGKRLPSPDQQTLALLLLWGFVEPDLRAYAHFVGSDRVGYRVGEALVELMNLQSRSL